MTGLFCAICICHFTQLEALSYLISIPDFVLILFQLKMHVLNENVIQLLYSCQNIVEIYFVTSKER